MQDLERAVQTLALLEAGKDVDSLANVSDAEADMLDGWLLAGWLASWQQQAQTCIRLIVCLSLCL